MERRKKKVRKKPLYRMMQTGPMLSAAVVAEKVLREGDDVQSLIRIIDRVLVPEEQTASLKKGEPMLLPFSLFFMVKAGDFTGKCAVSIYQINPSGHRELVETQPMTVTFPAAPDSGINLQVPLILKWESAGQYYFELALDDVSFCRVPLLIASKELPPINRATVSVGDAGEEKRK